MWSTDFPHIVTRWPKSRAAPDASAPIKLMEGILTMPLIVVDKTGHEVRRVTRVLK